MNINSVNTTSGTEKTEKTSRTEKTQKTEKTSRTKKSSKTEKSKLVELTTEKPLQIGKTDKTVKNYKLESGQFSPETKELVDQFYNAVYGLGTDEKNMTDALSKINKDNVIDVMRCWNKYHSNEAGESFMEAFMWDAGHGDKKTYGKQIAALLRDKADELGIYDQCKDEFSHIDKEMRAVFYVSNDVAGAYDSIINKIAMKEGLDYSSPHKK